MGQGNFITRLKINLANVKNLIVDQLAIEAVNQPNLANGCFESILAIPRDATAIDGRRLSVKELVQTIAVATDAG